MHFDEVKAHLEAIPPQPDDNQAAWFRITRYGEPTRRFVTRGFARRIALWAQLTERDIVVEEAA